MKGKKTAVVLKKGIMGNQPGYSEQWHCKVSPRVRYRVWSDGDENRKSRYIIVSAVNNSRVFETYIFPADKAGEIVDWGELDGSQKRTIDHEMVLEEAGYTVVMPEETESATAVYGSDQSI